MRDMLLAGNFESAEIAFVQRYLQPGMTALDLGAHNGLYSLVASKRVGPLGKVIAFEPSPRERRALRLHLVLNRCRNVSVQGLALGNEASEADLFVVDGIQTGCNSLRPPDVLSGTSVVRVQVTTLDHWLAQKGISQVDFIKLDVEGAELDVLKGASALLQNRPRPLIMAEVQEVRTAPWGYRAKEIIHHLSTRGYKWLRLAENGSVDELETTADEFDGNFVAIPEERMFRVMEMNRDGSRS